MFGVLLASHGRLAEGFLDSCKLFFGEPEKIEAVCLLEGESVDDFDNTIKEKLEVLDDGNGVVILCDLYGGTPSNRCVYLLTEGRHIKVFTGMNFTLLLELLGMRMNADSIDEIDVEKLLTTGQIGIKDLAQQIQPEAEDEEFF